MEPHKTEDVFEIILEYVIPYIYKKESYLFLQLPENYDFIDAFFAKSFWFSGKPKFEVLKEFVGNPFLSKIKKEELIEYFYKTQRLTNFFKKFYIKKTYHKYHKYPGNIDLFHVPLDTYSTRSIIPLVHNNTIYKFRVSDIIRLTNTGLIYAPDLFPEPKFPSNPWTNIPFTETNLYNIYFHMIDNNILLPTLFYNFFRCNWKIEKFICLNEAYLRDVSINHFYDDVSTYTKYSDIIIMLRKYRSVIPDLTIHPQYPKLEVVSNLAHILVHHLRYEYTHNPTYRIKSKITIKRLLRTFFVNNPAFGRIIINTRRPFRFQTFGARIVIPDNSNVLNLSNNFTPNSNVSHADSYLSLNLLSDSIPNYSHVDDILDHISEDITNLNQPSLINAEPPNEDTTVAMPTDDDNIPPQIDLEFSVEWAEYCSESEDGDFPPHT
jgi:hypothetical protein